MRKLSFSKLQATGNDFILIDARGLEQDWAELARAMCHRHFGIGADGLLLFDSVPTYYYWKMRFGL